MTKLTPDSFRLTFLEEAHRLRRSAISNSTSHRLDARTSMWIVRLEAWRDFQSTGDFLNVAIFGSDRRKELLGLPVRVTIDDEPDVPMLQLVMEPQALVSKGKV